MSRAFHLKLHRAFTKGTSVRGQFRYFAFLRIFLGLLKTDCGGFCGDAPISSVGSYCGHCVNNAIKITVHLGAWETYNVIQHTCQIMYAYLDNVIMHPCFDFIMADYDVALIKLQASIQFTDYIQPIRLMDNAYHLKI